MAINLNYTTVIPSQTLLNNDTLFDNTYLIKVEMTNGASHFVQITKEEAIALGIELPEIQYVQTQVATEVKPIKRISNNEVHKSPKKSKTKYNYKVIQPEDLNLIPYVPPEAPPAAKGRPKKKKQYTDVDKKTAVDDLQYSMKLKTVRTRAGRMTKLPFHIEEGFVLIPDNDTSREVRLPEEKNNLRKDITAPIKENAPIKVPPYTSQEPPPLVPLKNKNNSNIALPKEKKKRIIKYHYRCSTCKKVYLGRNKMSQHLRKHPDHGLITQLNMEHGETWSCLIERSLKSKDGEKGTTFCKELLFLIKNCRTLAKYFLRPAKADRHEYYIDSLLSNVLNIKEGYYKFNENELCKDISIFSFLEIFDDSFGAHVIIDDNKREDTNKDESLKTPEKKFPDNILSLGDELDCKKIKQTNELLMKKDNNKTNVNLHFESEILDVMKNDITPSQNKPYFNNKTSFSDIINFVEHKETNESNTKSFENSKDDSKSDLVIETFHDNKFSDAQLHDHFNTTGNSFIPSLNKTNDKGSMEIDMLSPISNLPATELTEKVKSDRNKLDIMQTSNPLITTTSLVEDSSNNKSLFDTHLSRKHKDDFKKSDDFDIHKLHNLFNSDELILSDSNQVGSILDTSINSDDIMNVDQFVNERFKRLTEVDLDLPMDCFNFHSN